MLTEEEERWREVKGKKEEDRGTRKERRRRWFEKRGEKIRRERKLEEAERERKMEEEKRSRERNVIWKGVGGDNEEKRLWSVEEILKRILGREVGVRGMEERRGDGGRWVLIMEVEKVKDKKEVLEKRAELGRRWRVGVDEDLTMEERRRSWRMVEAARRERESKGYESGDEQ